MGELLQAADGDVELAQVPQKMALCEVKRGEDDLEKTDLDMTHTHISSINITCDCEHELEYVRLIEFILICIYEVT